MRFWILFLTVFVDLIGFGIVLPLLPIYADRFGASGTQIGLLVLSYSAAQLLFAPIWGRLSDRFGRRGILIVGLLGSAISYLIFAFAPSFSILLLSRILAGVGGANLSVAQAYVADVTTPEERAGKLGILGAAFALGFVFGPAIGGILAPISPVLPGLVASILCAINALLAFVILPESRPGKRKSTGATEGPLPGGIPSAATVTGTSQRSGRGGRTLETNLLLVLSLFFLFTAAFSVMHPSFALLMTRRFGMTETDVGWLYAFLGVVSAITQGVFVPAMARRGGEIALVRGCALPLAGGLAIVGLTTSLPLLFVGVALMAAGMGGSTPALTGLLSRMASSERQGGTLGIGQSASALARVVGPLLGGILWDLAGESWPYLAGAGLALLAGIGSLALANPATLPITSSESPSIPVADS